MAKARRPKRAEFISRRDALKIVEDYAYNSRATAKQCKSIREELGMVAFALECAAEKIARLPFVPAPAGRKRRKS